MPERHRARSRLRRPSFDSTVTGGDATARHGPRNASSRCESKSMPPQKPHLTPTPQIRSQATGWAT
eukprot:8562501-Pyramimonas_sp.AAC.1